MAALLKQKFIIELSLINSKFNMYNFKGKQIWSFGSYKSLVFLDFTRGNSMYDNDGKK